MAIDKNSGEGAPNPNGEGDSKGVSEEVSKDGDVEDPPPKKRRRRCDEVGYTPAPPMRSKSLTVKELLTAMRERALHQSSGEKIKACENGGDEREDGVHDPGQELYEVQDDGVSHDRLGLEVGGAQGVEGMIVEKMRYLSCRGEDRGLGEAFTIDNVGGQFEGMRCVRSLKIKNDYTDEKCEVKWDGEIKCEVLKGGTEDKASNTALHTSRDTENDNSNTTEEGDLEKDEDLRNPEGPGSENSSTEKSLDTGENQNLNL